MGDFAQDYAYRRDALVQFFARPAAVEDRTPDEIMLAGERLIDTVYAAVRARYPAHEALIDQCTLHRYPLACLVNHPVMGPLAIQCMLDMALIVPKPRKE